VAEKQNFRSAEATHWKDSRAIWHGQQAYGSAWPCEISPQSVHGDWYAAAKSWKFHFFVESPSMSEPLTNFYNSVVMVCFMHPTTLHIRTFRFAIWIYSLFESIRIDSFCKKNRLFDSHYRSFRRRVSAVSHLHWYWQTRTTKRHNTCKTHTNATYKMALLKPRLRERTDRAWFSRLLRHLVRKRSGSILTTRSPHGATKYR